MFFSPFCKVLLNIAYMRVCICSFFFFLSGFYSFCFQFFGEGLNDFVAVKLCCLFETRGLWAEIRWVLSFVERGAASNVKLNKGGARRKDPQETVAKNGRKRALVGEFFPFEKFFCDLFRNFERLLPWALACPFWLPTWSC